MKIITVGLNFFFRLICTTAQVVCITAMVNHVLVRLSTSKGREKPPSPAHKTGSRYHLGVNYFQNVRRAPPSFIRMLKASAQTFAFAARHNYNYYYFYYYYLFICLMKIKTRMSSNTIMARRPQETSRLIIEATSTVVDKQNKSA